MNDNVLVITAHFSKQNTKMILIFVTMVHDRHNIVDKNDSAHSNVKVLSSIQSAVHSIPKMENPIKPNKMGTQ